MHQGNFVQTLFCYILISLLSTRHRRLTAMHTIVGLYTVSLSTLQRCIVATITHQAISSRPPRNNPARLVLLFGVDVVARSLPPEVSLTQLPCAAPTILSAVVDVVVQQPLHTVMLLCPLQVLLDVLSNVRRASCCSLQSVWKHINVNILGYYVN